MRKSTEKILSHQYSRIRFKQKKCRGRNNIYVYYRSIRFSYKVDDMKHLIFVINLVSWLDLLIYHLWTFL